LSLGLLSESVETGLIFPTPAPAEVTQGNTQTFDQIEAEITKPIVDENWWGGSSAASTGGADGAAPGAAPPEILGQVQLRPVQATTLSASDVTGLNEWLAQNGYRIKDAVTALLGGYVDRGWYFVALKITGDAKLNGGLDPMQFTFDSEELVYPMDLSRAAEEEQGPRTDRQTRTQERGRCPHPRTTYLVSRHTDQAQNSQKRFPAGISSSLQRKAQRSVQHPQRHSRRRQGSRLRARHEPYFPAHSRDVDGRGRAHSPGRSGSARTRASSNDAVQIHGSEKPVNRRGSNSRATRLLNPRFRES
jgi:hypothetical protein